MGNGFTHNGSEVARNSARGGAYSANLAVKEAAEFAQTVAVFMGAARRDQELWERLGINRNMIIEEAAREHHVTSGETGVLPSDWKERIEDKQDVGLVDWLARAR